MMRKMLSAFVNGLSIETTLAHNGKEAMDILEDDCAFDAAFIDWDMPIMTGIEFVENVKAQSRFSHIKLVMITSHNSMDDIQRAMNLQVDDYMMKPINEEMVHEKIKILGLVN